MCIVTRINCIVFTSSFTPSAIFGAFINSFTQYSHLIYIYFVHYLFIHSFLHSLTFPSLSYSFIHLFIHSFILIVSGGASQGYIVEIVVRYITTELRVPASGSQYYTYDSVWGITWAWFWLMTDARYIVLPLISRYHCLDPTNCDISRVHCTHYICIKASQVFITLYPLTVKKCIRS